MISFWLAKKVSQESQSPTSHFAAGLQPDQAENPKPDRLASDTGNGNMGYSSATTTARKPACLETLCDPLRAAQAERPVKTIAVLADALTLTGKSSCVICDCQMLTFLRRRGGRCPRKKVHGPLFAGTSVPWQALGFSQRQGMRSSKHRYPNWMHVKMAHVGSAAAAAAAACQQHRRATIVPGRCAVAVLAATWASASPGWTSIWPTCGCVVCIKIG